MVNNMVLQEEQFYELLSFLISSAYLMSQGEEFEELYPSMRLMDAANRLTKYTLESGGLEDESWLRSFLIESEKGVEFVGVDNEAFKEFLTHTTLTLAKEMKKRTR